MSDKIGTVRIPDLLNIVGNIGTVDEQAKKRVV